MQSQLITHVRDFIFAEERFFLHLQGTLLVVVEVDGGPVVAGFFQGAFEDFHNAVGVCVAGGDVRGRR